MATLDELVARVDKLLANQERLFPSHERVTNAALTLANSIVQLTKKIEQTGALHEESRKALDAAREAITEMLENRDTDNFALHSVLGEINTNLSLMERGVNNVERDVREATGPHRLPSAEELVEHRERRKGALVQGLEAFGKMPRTTQLIVALIVVVALALGRLLHISGE